MSVYGFCSKLKGMCPFLRYRVRAKGRLVVKVGLVGALPWPAPGCWVMEGADPPQRKTIPRSWDPWLHNKHEAIPLLGTWRRPHACPRDSHFIKVPILTSRCPKCRLWVRPHRQRTEGVGCFSPQRTASNELLLGIQLLSYPMGLKKQPMKPSVNSDQMTGPGALSAMGLSRLAGLHFLCGPCGSCHWQLRVKTSGWDSCRTACAQIHGSKLINSTLLTWWVNHQAKQPWAFRHRESRGGKRNMALLSPSAERTRGYERGRGGGDELGE